MRTYATSLLLLLAMLAWSGSARAGTSYDNCTGFITSIPTTISAPGTWCLKTNLYPSDPSGTAITINADQVTIDCNDFLLGGPGPSNAEKAFGIVAVNRSDVTVRHCNLVGGNYKGISLEGTSGSGYLVEDNRLSGQTNFGIVVAGTKLIVRRNVITVTTPVDFTDSATAIVVNGSSATSDATADVSDNTILGVSSTFTSEPVIGIDVTGVTKGSIRGNQIQKLLSVDHPGFPIGIRAQSTTNLAIRDNDISVGSGQTGFGTGIYCDTASTGRVTNNEIGGFQAGISGCGDAGRNDVSP